MKTLKTKLKLSTLLLALVMLFQSCTVYKSTPITMDRAVQNESKVKIKTKNGETLKFKRIGFENGNYYGVKKTKGEMLRMPLDETYISSIKEKDKTFSTVLTIAIPVTIVLGALVIIGSSLDFGLGSGSGNWDITF